jgi:hypothetical protein
MEKSFKKKGETQFITKIDGKNLKKEEGETQFITKIDGKKFLKKKAKLSLSPKLMVFCEC